MLTASRALLRAARREARTLPAAATVGAFARALRRHGLRRLPRLALMRVYRRLFQNRNWVFRLQAGDIPPLTAPAGTAEFELMDCRQPSEVSPGCWAQITASEGIHVLNQFSREFASGGVLWIASIGSCVVGYVWSRHGGTLATWFVPLRPHDVVLHSAVIFPQWRGRRIFSEMIRAIAQATLASDGCAYIDCKVWNEASLHSIQRAGFQIVRDAPFKAPPRRRRWR